MSVQTKHRYAALIVGFALLASGGAHAAQGRGPLKVFILAGQSNMDGQAHVRTIDFLGEDSEPARAALLKTFKPDGKNLVTRDDVWVANAVNDILKPGFGGRRNYARLGGNIGPEYSFGYFMGEAFEEQVLLIKFAPGGQSLHVNFRPPSAGKTGNAKLDEQGVVGQQYRNLVKTVHNTLGGLKKLFPGYDEKAGHEIVGLVWFQGFNDMFDVTGRKQYGQNLVHLIKDLRTEFKASEMKVVVGVMGVNGVDNEKNPKQRDVRGGQRFINTVQEFKGNAKAVETAPLLDPAIVKVLCAGWLYPERDLKKNPVTKEEKAMLRRATSNRGYHYYGSGRFMILAGKTFADTMLELLEMKE
ncbi:MAG: sialate O-acetylesterase [Planctomycetota bacterium]|jgi:alpha-galactosidase|nr:sialate O-acetylesterase [Planctomycetota bacterium]MDP6504712.1 sialate O-acetylesterase [Planctomycetota bacterium]